MGILFKYYRLIIIGNSNNIFIQFLYTLNKECSMDIKLFGCLSALSVALYGCATSSSTQGYTDKVVSDGSHLIGLPMTRDFIVDVNKYPKEIELNYQTALNKVRQELSSEKRNTSNLPDKKIFSIKPVGNTNPRAVILLKPTDITRAREWTVRKKNITLCEGFMTLPLATEIEQPESQQVRDNEVITFMPIKGENKKHAPQSPKDCQDFISNKNGRGYDYASALQELEFILDGKISEDGKDARSPFLAIYESPQSPYSSMILSLGELHPDTIALLGKNWPELITKVYRSGKSLDPVAATAAMLVFDPALAKFQKDARLGYVKIGVAGTICGGAIAASTITLNTLFATPACAKFIRDTANAFGYSVPENLDDVFAVASNLNNKKD